MMITETRSCSHNFDEQFPLFDTFTKPASSPRAAGEVLLLAIRRHTSYTSQIWHQDDSSLWVRISDPLQRDTPWFVGVTYLPPQGSRKLAQKGVQDRLDALAEMAAAAAELGHVLLGGDFNARVAGGSDSLIGAEEGVSPVRGFTDTVFNAHGRQLLGFCQKTGLLLCSGRITGDLDATPTFKARANTQGSRLDHILTTPAAFKLLQYSAVNAHQQGSDHWPIETKGLLHFGGVSLDPAAADDGVPLRRARWRSDRQQQYGNALLQGGHLQDIIRHAEEGRLEAAAETFSEAMDAAAAAGHMQAGTKHSQQPHKRSPCFVNNAKVDALKRTVRQLQRHLPHSTELRDAEARYHKESRRVTRALERENFSKMTQQICRDPHTVYATLKGRPKRLPLHLQATSAWKGYITKLAAGASIAARTLLNPYAVPHQPSPAAASSPAVLLPQIEQRRSDAMTLNGPITLKEVQSGLHTLNNNRSPGLDGYPAEFLRYAIVRKADGKNEQIMLPALTTMLNAAFNQGAVPDSWNVSLVTPIYKHGDAAETSNYRPIAVGAPIMRLLAAIINQRIVDFTEGHGLRSPIQAGFRPGMSCGHQLTALQHFIDQEVQQHKGHLYCCFVDLKGAYDNVPRDLLWQTLASLGIHGNILASIKGMYANSSLAIKIGGKRGELHTSQLGVKQGCPLSPTLFGLYMDALHTHLLHTVPAAGPRLSTGLRVPVLMYADDIVLMATTPQGLQQLIDATYQLCRWKKMQISAEKTAVVVFGSTRRKAPIVHSWTCGGMPLQQRDSYKYLGLLFTSKHGVAGTMPELQRRQNAAYGLLRQRYKNLRCHCAVTLMLELQQAIVEPTASYGCEVWGLRHMPHVMKQMRQGLEKHYVAALRTLCAVRCSVPAAVMLQELDLLPLQMQWKRSVLRLWNNFASFPHDSIYRTIALDDLEAAQQHGIMNWAAGVLECAEECHFSLMSLTNDEMNLAPLDCITIAASAAADAERCRYDTFDPRTAPSKGAKQYTYQAWFARPSWAVGPEFWQLDLSVQQIRAVMRLRLGSHSLPIETGRMQKPTLPRRQRTCQYCDAGSVGDEQHLLLECAATDGARAAFPALFAQQPPPSMQQFVWQRDRAAVAQFMLACLSSVGLITART